MMNSKFAIHSSLFAIFLFLFTFIIYLKTLCPTVFWRDTGEFLVAAYSLGIPHSPGTPIYPLIGRLFSLLPLGTIPFRINLMSAFFASISVVLLYFCILFLLRITDYKSMTTRGGRIESRITEHFAALTGSLLFAFSHPFWMYSVVAEVYTLQQALTASILLVSLLIFQIHHSSITIHQSRIFLLAFLFGLSLTNHGTSVLMTPALIYLAFSIQHSVFRIKYFPFFILLFALPLSLYLFLPIRSVQNPYLDWGDPENLERLIWMLSASEFQQQFLSLAYALTGGIVEAFKVYLEMILKDFTFFGIFLSLVGIIWLWRKNYRLLLFTGILFLSNLLYGFFFGADLELEAYLLSSHLIFAIWIGCGIYVIVKWLNGNWLNRIWRIHSALRLPISAIFLLLPLWTLIKHYPERDLSGNETAKKYVFEVAQRLEEGEIFLTENSVDLFLFYYLQAVENMRKDIVPVYLPYLRYEWHRDKVNNELAGQNSKFKIEDLLTTSYTLSNDKLKMLIANFDMTNAHFTYTPLSKIQINPELLRPSGFVFEVTDEPLSPEVIQWHKSIQKDFYNNSEFSTLIPDSPFNRLDSDTRRHFRILHSSLGEFFFQRGLFDEAEREYQTALRADSLNERVRLNLGLVLEKQEKWELALEEYKKIGIVDPNRTGYTPIQRLQRIFESPEQSSVQSKAMERIGRIYLHMGEPSKTIPYLREALQQQSKRFSRSRFEDPSQKASLSKLHYNLGRGYLELFVQGQQSANLHSAIVNFQKAIQYDSTFVEAYNNLGVSYREQRNPELALNIFRKAIELNPGYPESRYNLGMTYLQMGKIPEAKIIFEILVKEYPQNRSFLSILEQIEKLGIKD
jgi:tetratricopeptide (TPR) repeat protein